MKTVKGWKGTTNYLETFFVNEIPVYILHAKKDATADEAKAYFDLVSEHTSEKFFAVSASIYDNDALVVWNVKHPDHRITGSLISTSRMKPHKKHRGG